MGVRFPFIILVLFNVVACGGGTKSTSVDSNGNCTPQYVDDHNDLASKIRHAKEVGKSQQVSRQELVSEAKSVSESCHTFLNTHSCVGRRLIM